MEGIWGRCRSDGSMVTAYLGLAATDTNENAFHSCTCFHIGGGASTGTKLTPKLWSDHVQEVLLILTEWLMKQASQPLSACRCDVCWAAASTHHMIACTYCSFTVQSEACFEAMQIDWAIIRQQAMHRGVIMTRVAVRDFDHNDQVCTAKSCNQPHFTNKCCFARTAQCIMLV